MTVRVLFLSEEWIAKATELREEVEATYGDQIPKPPAKVAVNITITGIPHRDDLTGHIDTTGGNLIITEGNLDNADVSVTTDYITAAELFTSDGPEAFMSAMMPAVFGGRILVEGNLNELMPLIQQQAGQAGDVPAEARAISARIMGFTEV